MKGEAWLRAENPATVRAVILEKPAVAAKLLKRAKSPVMVVGHEAGGEGPGILDPVARIARATGAVVLATGGVSAGLAKRGFTGGKVMSAMEAGDRLLDPAWEPGPGRSPPDYAFFLGIPYPIASVIEAGLASFARGRLKIVALDRRYHPHCDLSLPNQTREEWQVALGAIAKEVERG